MALGKYFVIGICMTLYMLDRINAHSIDISDSIEEGQIVNTRYREDSNVLTSYVLQVSA